MFSYNHYIPILRSKQAEFNALKNLEPALKKHISPFFKVVEVERHRDTKLPKKNPQKHLNDVGTAIIKALNGHLATFVDLNDIVAVSYGTIDPNDVVVFFKKIKEAGINIIPARGLHLLPPHEKAILEVCANLKTGLCLRLDLDDIDNENLDNELKDVLKRNNIKSKDCDIIIDLEKFKNGFRSINKMVDLINTFPDIKSWRTFTIAISSFPEKIEKGVTHCSRDDFRNWRELIKKKTELQRVPSYGDYGIQEPGWSTTSVSYQGAVNLRYALTDEWVLFKGRKQKKGDSQFPDMCRKLIQYNEYNGPDFCWADEHINDCAMGHTGPGSGTTWRQVGFNRHMALTIIQMRTL